MVEVGSRGSLDVSDIVGCDGICQWQVEVGMCVERKVSKTVMKSLE